MAKKTCDPTRTPAKFNYHRRVASRRSYIATGAANSAAAPDCPICWASVDLTLSADNPKTAMTSTPLLGYIHSEYFHVIGQLHNLQVLYLSNTRLIHSANWPATRAQLQEANPHITITDNE